MKLCTAVCVAAMLLGLSGLQAAQAELSVGTLTTNVVQGQSVAIPFEILAGLAQGATGKVEVVMLLVGGDKATRTKGTIRVKRDRFVYAPAKGFTGTDSLNYILADEKSRVTGTVAIQVTEDTTNPPKKNP